MKIAINPQQAFSANLVDTKGKFNESFSESTIGGTSFGNYDCYDKILKSVVEEYLQEDFLKACKKFKEIPSQRDYFFKYSYDSFSKGESLNLYDVDLYAKKQFGRALIISNGKSLPGESLGKTAIELLNSVSNIKTIHNPYSEKMLTDRPAKEQSAEEKLRKKLNKIF